MGLFKSNKDIKTMELECENQILEERLENRDREIEYLKDRTQKNANRFEAAEERTRIVQDKYASLVKELLHSTLVSDKGE